MSQSEKDAALQRLLDKDAICDVFSTYIRAGDRCDAEMMETVFHPDAIEIHFGVERSPRDFIDFAMPLLRQIGNVAHYWCMPLIKLEGDTAWVESYAIAWHRMNDPQGPYDSVWGARVFDRFERRDGAWRIAWRRVIYDWNRDDPVSETWNKGFFSPGIYSESRKDKSDPMYEFRAMQPR
jgi:hypothetical protein